MQQFKYFFFLFFICLKVYSAPTELSWSDLIPEGAPPPPPPIPIHNLNNLASTLESELGPAAKQESPNAPIKKSLNNTLIKIPGYIVPLEIDSDGITVTDFLLVPYYGACIHVPPPPSNQIIYVTGAKDIKLDELYEPFWVEGKITTNQKDSSLASAGYHINTQKIYPFEYPN